MKARTALAEGTGTHICIMKNYTIINLCTVVRTLDLDAFHRS